MHPRQDRRGEEPGVGGAGAADRQRADRNALAASGRSTGASRPRGAPCSRPARQGPAGSRSPPASPAGGPPRRRRRSARPAPAPRPRGHSGKPLGRPVRRDDLRLVGDTELGEHLGACRRVSQSDRLPITTPTRGVSEFKTGMFDRSRRLRGLPVHAEEHSGKRISRLSSKPPDANYKLIRSSIASPLAGRIPEAS